MERVVGVMAAWRRAIESSLGDSEFAQERPWFDIKEITWLKPFGVLEARHGDNYLCRELF